MLTCGGTYDAGVRSSGLFHCHTMRCVPVLRGQRDRVVSVSDSLSSGPGFESRSDHYLDLFLGSPEFKTSSTLVNNKLVYLRPVGILNNVMFNLKYLFQLFARPH